MSAQKKIAIVYDWIDKWGGVERILLALHEMFPDAPFYTSYVDRTNALWAKDINIVPSFIQKLPVRIRKSRMASLVFFPFAFESFVFNNFDTVISVSSSFSKSVITKPQTKHLSIMLTPTRYLWSHAEGYRPNIFPKKILKPYLKYLENWDFVSAQRADIIYSISKNVQERCRKYYHRESELLYPPFDIDYWKKIKTAILNSKSQINPRFKIPNTNYYLIVSRLERYKKIDLAIEVFNRLGETLVVVGTGTQEKELKQIAKSNILFIPYVSDDELALIYSHAQALIMPQEEDFGYVSVEAQLFGCPVIAYALGGAKETIIHGKTGIFFEKQTRDSLTRAVEDFHTISYNLKNSIRIWGMKNVERFNKEKFFEIFQSVITNYK